MMRGWVADLYQKVRARQAATGSSVRVTADHQGIGVERSGTSARRAVIAWQGVRSITAFKRDAYIYDLVCLAIEHDQQLTELHEEMDGWQTLVEQLERALPSAVPYSEWFLEVIAPALDAKPTLVYERNGRSSPLTPPRHSSRSETSGSTRMARREGT
jgi:hypothetical protein